jgi:uncharacterized protein YndB with AHSA1/START domain
MKGFVASASVLINAPVEKVWDSLINPDIIKKYMFGSEVISDWEVGSPVRWKGKWQGKSYEDKGTVIRKIPLKTLELTHFSPLSGAADESENYHRLIFNLSSTGPGTTLHLVQDNNPDEISRNHSQENWEMMLQNLKKLLEE